MAKALLHELGKSISFGRLSLLGKVLWPMLLAASDDQGRGEAEPDVVKWTVCPNVAELTIENLGATLQEMVDQEMVYLYSDSRGRKLYQIVRWWGPKGSGASLQWAQPSAYEPPEGWTDRIRSQRGKDYTAVNWDKPGGFDSGEPSAIQVDNPGGEPPTESPEPTTQLDLTKPDLTGLDDAGEPAPENPPPDVLDDIFAHAQKPEANERPSGWEFATEPEYAISKRVADLWGTGKLPTGQWGDRIEKQAAGAIELLRHHDGDLQACLLTIDRYHAQFDGGITISGPQSLVGVIPAFMAEQSRPRASPGRKRGHRETVWEGEVEQVRQFVEQQEAAATEEEPLDVEAMLGPEA